MGSRKRRSRKKRGPGAATNLLGLFLFPLLAAGAGAWWMLTPFGPTTETFVNVAPGTSTLRIGRQLQDAGVVRSQYAFYALRWFQRGALRAGDFRFDHPASPVEVYKLKSRAETFLPSP